MNTETGAQWGFTKKTAAVEGSIEVCEEKVKEI